MGSRATEMVVHGLPLWQFSLRSLFILMSLTCGLCMLSCIWPHLAILVGAVLAAAATTWMLIRRIYRRRGRVVVLTVATALAWSVLYVASIGPLCVLSIEGYLSSHWEEVLEAFYAPLAWLHSNTAFREVLDWYLFLWLDAYDVSIG